jgi:phosphoribosylformylglycinamidine synthase subunit PurL
VPVTGGNVSFYNQTGTVAIHPTPVIGVLGVHDDVRRRLGIGFAADEGHSLVLLGNTREEFGGSAWAHVLHGHLGGKPPEPDLEAELRLAEVLVTAAANGLLSAAHDLSDGGLAVALAESCLRGGVGCRVTLPDDPFTALFSESVARAVVAVRPGSESAFAALCAEQGVPAAEIGTTGGDSLVVDGCFEVAIPELAQAHEGTLPGIFGLCRPGGPTRAGGRMSGSCWMRSTPANSRRGKHCRSRSGICCSCWRSGIPGMRWRCGCRQSRPCSAWTGRGTPGGPRPT